MIFNSIEFFVFLPLVFFLYYLPPVKKSKRLQNTVVLTASYVFYGWWDWRFLTLLLLSTFTDYIVALSIHKQEDIAKRKILLLTSIIVNLSLLGFFKYYNFFVDNFVAAFSFFGLTLEKHRLNIILPVGISFYTFQTMSYTIDVYKRKLRPVNDFCAFAAFVSFFPQLVAGPIERAASLLPQFYHNRKFDYSGGIDGCKLMLWGFFKKIVIADNCAVYANSIFNNYNQYHGSTLLLGAVFFAFQIYGDFSGYSDIAAGTARLFGISLSRNFTYPYFSSNIAEFWRRWHISLTTWFKDYVYIPLGGSRRDLRITIRNTFIIFILSGFWHGAKWTFVFWGFLNALYFMPSLCLKTNRTVQPLAGRTGMLQNGVKAVQITVTFALTVVAWIFFRAENLPTAFDYLFRMFSAHLFSLPEVIIQKRVLMLLACLLFFILIEIFGRKNKYAIEKMPVLKTRITRWGMYYFLLAVITVFAVFNIPQSFIYFQF